MNEGVVEDTDGSRIQAYGGFIFAYLDWMDERKVEDDKQEACRWKNTEMHSYPRR